MITKEQVQELTKKFSIDWYSVIREYFQIIFLSCLYEDKVSHEVFFKGGTAIRLLLNSFRFSEDLDFTTNLNSEDLEKLVSKTVKKINLIAQNVTFKRLKSIDKTFTGTLGFQSDEYKYPLNIHIDFSYREKPLTQKESVLETIFPVSPYPLVVHMSWEEILAEKVRALMTRAKGRDLFDIWYLLSKGIAIDMKLANKKMELYNKQIKKEDIVNKIKSFKEEILINDLNKYLPSTHRKMTSKLKDMVLEKLK